MSLNNSLSQFPSLVELTKESLITPADVLALVVHAVMLDMGFRLQFGGNTEDGLYGRMTTGEVAIPVLPADWTSLASFHYIHPLWTLIEEPPTTRLVLSFDRKMPERLLVSLSTSDDAPITFTMPTSPYIDFTLPLNPTNVLPNPSLFLQFFSSSLLPHLLPLLSTGSSSLKNNLPPVIAMPSSPFPAPFSTSAPRDLRPTSEASSLFDDTHPPIPPPSADPYGLGRPHPLGGLPPFRPDGSLIGPNHPSFGNPFPTVGPAGGGLPGIGGAPRFDPLGPLGGGTGEPDPDQAPLLGKLPDHMFM
eukprot:GHVS01073822.1.p1 GENE.GHVS01073822.1~~GHVS01073822.1.p1  ORF type:complete len:304 (-),score=33.66 GHVS01073822.1:124-1035(-)